MRLVPRQDSERAATTILDADLNRRELLYARILAFVGIRGLIDEITNNLATAHNARARVAIDEAQKLCGGEFGSLIEWELRKAKLWPAHA